MTTLMPNAEIVVLAVPGRHRGRRRYLRDLTDWLQHQRARLSDRAATNRALVRAYREALAWRDYALTKDGPNSDLVADAEASLTYAGSMLGPFQRLTAEIEYATRH